MTLQDFYKDVVHAAYKDYSNLSSSLSNGTLILEKFDEFVKIDERARMSDKINPNWTHKFEKLMLFSKSNKTTVKERLEQLSIYLDLSKVNDIAKVLLQLKAKNGLKNNYSFLDEIASSV
jgi:hypothetical protein